MIEHSVFTFKMSYLVWQIAARPSDIIRSAIERPTSGLTAAGLQVVNPKTSGMAVAAISIFSGANADFQRHALLSGIFMMVSIPFLGFGPRSDLGLVPLCDLEQWSVYGG